jgi:acylphosphatase
MRYWPDRMADESNAAVRAVVRGLVQGVGFREYVMTRARFLGLRGYVANLPDGGAVEIFAEGPRDGLEQLLDHLGDGPRYARVDAVDSEWLDPTGQFQGFGVRFLG